MSEDVAVDTDVPRYFLRILAARYRTDTRERAQYHQDDMQAASLPEAAQKGMA